MKVLLYIQVGIFTVILAAIALIAIIEALNKISEGLLIGRFLRVNDKNFEFLIKFMREQRKRRKGKLGKEEQSK